MQAAVTPRDAPVVIVGPPSRAGAEAALPRSQAAITVAWLVRLRWGAALGQTLTVAVAVLGLGITLPIVPLALLVGVTIVSNALLAARSRRPEDVSTRGIGLVLAGDVLVLSALLYCSGGPSNPFSVMYLVHVTLAALVLGVRWAAAMVTLSALLYAALFFWHVPIAELSHVHDHGALGQKGALSQQGASPFSVHLQGMWIAFTIAAALIAYFVARVAGALRARETELALARAAAARAERLASLTTLAAGAAHELGTPLGTIAIAGAELERAVRTSASRDEVLEDARLIRAEVERCRAIVHRMSAQAGDTLGELPRRTTPEEVLRGCVERLGKDAAAGLVLGEVVEARFTCPTEGAIQVVLSLVQNARWAVRASGGSVVLSSTCTDDAVRLVVTDEGVGIGDELLARIGEPFVTTKPPGEGMGLGLFLARTFAERWGGRFDLRSSAGRGTVATLELPRAEDDDG